VKRPLIGVTSSGSEDSIILKNRYFNALWDAGCIPTALPNELDWSRSEEYADLFDGFLFTGGVDVDPRYYMEDRSPLCGEVQSFRDGFELSLLASVMLRGKPVLGICRGIQLLNVGLGGSLYQHVEGHIQNGEKGLFWHPVYIYENSLLADILKEKSVEVNSYHHQMVKGLGKGLKSCADLSDGRCEAIWLPGHRFFLGVQWHPEMTCRDDEASRRIFEAFAAACRMEE